MTKAPAGDNQSPRAGKAKTNFIASSQWARSPAGRLLRQGRSPYKPVRRRPQVCPRPPSGPAQTRSSTSASLSTSSKRTVPVAELSKKYQPRKRKTRSQPEEEESELDVVEGKTRQAGGVAATKQYLGTNFETSNSEEKSIDQVDTHIQGQRSSTSRIADRHLGHSTSELPGERKVDEFQGRDVAVEDFREGSRQSTPGAEKRDTPTLRLERRHLLASESRTEDSCRDHQVDRQREKHAGHGLEPGRHEGRRRELSLHERQAHQSPRQTTSHCLSSPERPWGSHDSYHHQTGRFRQGATHSSPLRDVESAERAKWCLPMKRHHSSECEQSSHFSSRGLSGEEGFSEHRQPSPKRSCLLIKAASGRLPRRSLFMFNESDMTHGRTQDQRDYKHDYYPNKPLVDWHPAEYEREGLRPLSRESFRENGGKPHHWHQSPSYLHPADDDDGMCSTQHLTHRGRLTDDTNTRVVWPSIPDQIRNAVQQPESAVTNSAYNIHRTPRGHQYYQVDKVKGLQGNDQFYDHTEHQAPSSPSSDNYWDEQRHCMKQTAETHLVWHSAEESQASVHGNMSVSINSYHSHHSTDYREQERERFDRRYSIHEKGRLDRRDSMRKRDRSVRKTPTARRRQDDCLSSTRLPKSSRLPQKPYRAEGTVCKLLLTGPGEPQKGFFKPHKPLPDGYPQKKDVFFNSKVIASGGIELKLGDKVFFTLGTRNPEKPMAVAGLLTEVDAARRSSEDVRTVLNHSLRLFAVENSIDKTEFVNSHQLTSSASGPGVLSSGTNCTGNQIMNSDEDHDLHFSGPDTKRGGVNMGDLDEDDYAEPLVSPAEETHPVLQVMCCRAVWTWLLNQPLSDENTVRILQVACAVADHKGSLRDAVRDFFRTMLSTRFMLPTVGCLSDWLTQQLKHLRAGGSNSTFPPPPHLRCHGHVCAGSEHMGTGNSCLPPHSEHQALEKCTYKSIPLPACTEQMVDRGTTPRLHSMLSSSVTPASLWSTERLSLLMEFITHMATVLPTHLRQVMAVCRPLIQAADHPVVNLLCNVIQQLRYDGDDEVQYLAWHALPLVPTQGELLSQSNIGDSLHTDLSKQPLLREVHINDGYCTADVYMDTYFRLLREDCFAGLREGVQHLLAGTLDVRDMHTYKRVQLVRIQTSRRARTGLSLSLKLQPKQRVQNWNHSRRLMFGSLLCISVDGKFKRPLWATVLERNADRLEKSQTIEVQLCNLQMQKVSLSQAVRQLQFAEEELTVMAESPAYYQSIGPVLDTLQHMEPDSLPFLDELVHVRPCRCVPGSNSTHSLWCRPPSYIQPDTTVDASVLFDFKPSEPHRYTVDALCNDMLMKSSQQYFTTLDNSQQKAIRHALLHRLAIIQGPPGTGKTFVGVQLLRLLLTANTRPAGPVLVLTYKNHALDEFLKQCLDYFGINAVVRLGGGCRDADLGPCLMQSVGIKPLPKSVRKSLGGARDRVSCQESDAMNVIKRLGQASVFSKLSFLEHVSNDQVKRFLINCEWSTIPSAVNGGQRVTAGDIAAWIRAVPNDLSLQEFLLNPPPRQLRQEEEDNTDSEEDDDERRARKAEVAKNSLQIEAYRYLHFVLDLALGKWIPNDQSLQDLDFLEKAEVKRLSKSDGAKSSGEEPSSGSHAANSQTGKSSQPTRSPEHSVCAQGHAEGSFDYDVEEEQTERMAACDVRQARESDDDTSRTWLSASNARVTRFKSVLLAKLLTAQGHELKLDSLLQHADLWSLSLLERAAFIQLLLQTLANDLDEELDVTLDKYEHDCSLLTEQEQLRDKCLLEGKKIIGMTICGASMKHRLLSQLKPAIVIVEEAAEVLEPQIMAVLQESVQHLILIGDHMQLRPPVETHVLRVKYHFDVSTMERLVKSGIAHSTLEQQNRMRPEVAELLHDIYPMLRSNINVVKQHTVPRSMPSAAFFWDHNCPETAGQGNIRSYTNLEEAQRALRLARFLTMQGYDKKTITILAAYKGQVALLRSLMSNYQLDGMLIHTIDNYQGDENNLVIVSLVRCNSSKTVGFLSELNRRCVAQSRARRGVYFIGSKDTLSSNRHWRNLLDRLSSRGCVSTEMKLSCRRHPYKTQFVAARANDIAVSPFCELMCGHVMDCQHRCHKACQPEHDHTCSEQVEYTFPKCGHTVMHTCGTAVRYCYQDVSLHLVKCGHMIIKKCWVRVENVKCHEVCPRKRTCGHPCERQCFEDCESYSCGACCKIAEEAKRQEEKKRLEAARRQVERELARLKEEGDSGGSKCTRVELEPSGDDASQYYYVSDLTEKFVQPGHDLHPRVTKIEKVYNPALHKQWLEVRMEMDLLEDSGQLKFHGTSHKGIEGILKEGFCLPKDAGMFGRGVYFATDSSKSTDSNALLVCKVLLGRSKLVLSVDPSLSAERLAREGYNSVFAKRGTRDSQGVRCDKHVVYDPRQALPCYMVHYNAVKSSASSYHSFEQQALAQDKIMSISLVRRRDVTLSDETQIHYNFVQSKFLDGLQQARTRVRDKTLPPYRITSVKYIVNPKLFRKFEKKRDEFKYLGKPPNCVFAFHGTKEDNIEPILQENFSLRRAKRGLYGNGVYFSEFPDVAMAYTNETSGGDCAPLLLCKVLTGKSFDCQRSEKMNNAPLTIGFDSHRVQADSEGYGEMLVIFDEAQILPCYVVHYSK